ncbi:MAG: NPCBM/NEW2 domain-containing protein, partial [Pirellulales bacterium]|nr:NPCBM/NEW2 domain-containing protein [Pirellulales bacterium]
MHIPPPNSRFSCLPILLCILCVLNISDSSAATVHPDEMSQTRRWAAAKFEGVSKQPQKKSGLNALFNHGPVLKNTRLGKPLNINGMEFRRGLFCHAPSKIIVRLPSPSKQFSAIVGVDSNYMTKDGRGSVILSVKVGNKELFHSEIMREGMKAVPVEVNLDGADEFVLEITDGGDGISCDQTDWADARVVLADGKTIWLDDMPLVEQKSVPYTTDPPFSFTYGGQQSSELLKQWKCNRQSRKLDDKRTEHTITWTDPKTGLTVRQVAVEYLDFPTVEWTLYFKNTGKQDTPILKSIQALDTLFQRGMAGEFVLHHLRGDLCTADSFEPLTATLAPKTTQRFAPSGGRPTNGQWP